MKYKYNDKFPTTCGIYLISFGSNKVYIGSAFKFNGKFDCQKGFYHRWHQHLQKLRSGNHHSIKLQNAYNKYGLNNLFFEIVEELSYEDLTREKFYIDKYNSYNNGYNCTKVPNSQTGLIHSEKSKKKMSESKLKKMDIIIKNKKDDFEKLFNKGLTFREIRNKLSITRRQGERIMECLKLSFKDRPSTKSKKVYVYKISNEVITIYNSVSEASKSTNVHTGRISAIALGNKGYFSSKGFIFSYKNKTKEEFKNVKTRSKKC